MHAKHALALVALIGGSTSAHAVAFTPGNLVVFQAAASVNNTTGALIEIDASTAGQSAVQTLAINGTTGGDALRFSGSATSTGYLSRSADGSQVAFVGANAATTTGNTNTILTRGVGTFDSAGTFSLAATYSGISGNQPRSATTLDGTQWFIADQGGIYTNDATAPSPAGNFRGIKAFGDDVYLGRASGTVGTSVVASVSAASGGTVSALTGLPNSSSFQDFYFVSSGNNGATFDLLYTLSATSNTAGTIDKYSLVSGSWISNGSFSTGAGGFGLAVSFNGTGSDIFFTTGQGALTANSVRKLTDAGGYNTSFDAGTATTLFTAPAGTIIKGIDFAPVAAIPEPASAAALAGLGMLGLAASRRRRRSA